jgi:hypothetical protein
MAAIPASYAQIYAEFNSLVYNPSFRFYSQQDILNYINRAVIETANEIGGIRVTDPTTTSVAAQRDYPVDTAIRSLIGAWYVQNYGNAATEIRTPLEVIDFKNEDALNQIGYLNAPTSGDPGFALTPTITPAVPVPLFIIFQPVLNLISLLPLPTNTGDVILLDALEIPNQLGVNVAYKGDPIEIGAIVFKAVALARLKAREIQESNAMDEKWITSCQSIKKMRQKMRRRRQLADGRFLVNRLRSFSGAE